jgi:hypothetical protein
VVKGLEQDGVTIPPDALNPKGDGSARVVEHDNNGGEPREITWDEFQQMGDDVAIVKSYLEVLATRAKLELPASPSGKSVNDLKLMRLVLAGTQPVAAAY